MHRGMHIIQNSVFDIRRTLFFFLFFFYFFVSFLSRDRCECPCWSVAPELPRTRPLRFQSDTSTSPQRFWTWLVWLPRASWTVDHGFRWCQSQWRMQTLIRHAKLNGEHNSWSSTQVETCCQIRRIKQPFLPHTEKRVCCQAQTMWAATRSTGLTKWTRKTCRSESLSKPQRFVRGSVFFFAPL